MADLINHPGMWLNDAAAADLNALEAKYGVIRINRAGVTERQQQDVIDKWDRGERAGLFEPRRPARESDHVKNGGEAVDIYNYTDDRAKMREFGFEQVYPKTDPVHYKHVRRVTGTGDPKVKREQEFLNMARGENLVTDGLYGPATREAYKRYQTFLGVTADGIWGDGTQAAHARYYAEWERSRQGGVINKTHTQIDYADIQRALNRHGYNLAVDNDWGPASSAALADFQRRNGLVADRIVGAKTWAKLNS